MRRIDDAVNGFRRAVERLLPWYDPEAEAAKEARTDAVVAEVKRVQRFSITTRVLSEPVIDSYRRADGTLGR